LEKHKYPATTMKASEFVDEFLDEIKSSSIGDSIGIHTMQLSPQPDISIR